MARPRPHALLLAAACTLSFGVGDAAAEEGSPDLLLQESYPLEATVSFSAALFHWVDSLAETSGGKTIPVYREDYVRRFGSPSADDGEALARFREIRLRHAARVGLHLGRRGSPAMLRAFLGEPGLESALESLRSEVPPSDLAGLRSSLEHFRPRYETVWQHGKVPRRFLDNARRDPARGKLEGLLARVARFFGVDLSSGERPRIVLVPVPSGGGTHAEAVGRHLLLEIRSWERLADEAAPIAHENAHFLWGQMSDERRARLVAVARDHPHGEQAWRVLREALPTAIGQGVVDRSLSPRAWSLDASWYHTSDVDEYAKAIYPLVQGALDSGSTLDEALLKSILSKFPRDENRGRQPAITPR